VSWGSWGRPASVRSVGRTPYRVAVRIALGRDRLLLGSRWVEVKAGHRSAGRPDPERAVHQVGVHRLAELAGLLGVVAPRPACERSLPPSCAPSIPCGSP
jgi:hypothetical protein